ncbi:holin-like protein CidA [Alicyclobacillus acidoterrestris]|uniref:CidA/LrgA family protein n=1 Tax=Alicyclobacillus suci TaxID=2816080 RepID=UPI00119061F5|nr:CidA/LrgA family protein [Alicyclobacillus suci]GEO24999.1 holin-like protein CidA [Alicyclobacillus acidoterrestris]
MFATISSKVSCIFWMILQVACLFGLSEIGTWISKVLHAPIPGSIWGLIILFLLLKFKIVKLEWVSSGGDWLIREMLLFFVPSSVGILSYGHLMLHQGIQIVVTIVTSTALVMVFTGAIAETIWKSRQRRKVKSRYAKEEASSC